ncbi:hypothetical protein B0H34DRAFT_680410 [Crassisporium funariophilum]|nr:hypothetical protein B0H34DRAFT_680410 [Crassisporium funariophilum]
MLLRSKTSSFKATIVKDHADPGHDWRTIMLNPATTLIDIKRSAVNTSIREAAGTAWDILCLVEAMKYKEEEFKELAKNGSQLVIAIGASYDISENKLEWKQSELGATLENTLITLQSMSKLLEEQGAKPEKLQGVRAFSKSVDAKIEQYRKSFLSAMKVFDVIVEPQQTPNDLVNHHDPRNYSEELHPIEVTGVIKGGSTLTHEEREEESGVSTLEQGTSIEKELEKMSIEQVQAEIEKQQAAIDAHLAEEVRMKDQDELDRLRLEEERWKQEDELSRTMVEQPTYRERDAELDEYMDEPRLKQKASKSKGRSKKSRSSENASDSDSIATDLANMNIQATQSNPRLASSPGSTHYSPTVYPDYSPPMPPYIPTGYNPLFPYGLPFQQSPTQYPASPPAQMIGIAGGHFSGNASPVINQNTGNISNVNYSNLNNDYSVNHYKVPGESRRRGGRRRPKS